MRTIHENNNGLSAYDRMLRAAKKRHAKKPEIIKPIAEKVVHVQTEAEPQIKKLSGQESELLAQLSFLQIAPGKYRRSQKPKLPDNYFHKLIISELRFVEIPPGKLKMRLATEVKQEPALNKKKITFRNVIKLPKQPKEPKPKKIKKEVVAADRRPLIRVKAEYTNRSPYGIASDYILESNRRH